MDRFQIAKNEEPSDKDKKEALAEDQYKEIIKRQEKAMYSVFKEMYGFNPSKVYYEREP